MLSGLESGLGLDVVVWLQAHGNGVFDVLAELMHILGGTTLYLVLAVLVLWTADHRQGVRLLVALLSSALVMEMLKEFFKRPRPYQLFPEKVIPLVDQGGYGLPSGHVMMAVIVGGMLALWVRRRGVTIAAVGYVLVMGWSRMYNGVHYPQDVALGLVVGGVMLWVNARLVDTAMPWWQGLTLPVQAVLLVAGTVAAVLVTQASEDGLTLTGLLLGCWAGLIWEGRAIRQAVGGSTGQRIARFGGGLALSLLVYGGLSVLLDGLEPTAVWRVARYALVGLTVSAIWPWCSIRLALATRRPGMAAA